MQQTLTSELFWLAMTVFMTGLFWVPYIVNWILEKGVVEALWNPAAYDHSAPRAGWAARMLQAHQNAVENLVIFIPLVLLLHIADVSTPATVTACMVYFFARLGHYLVFTFAIPFLRVATFLVGFAAQVVLALALLKAL